MYGGTRNGGGPTTDCLETSPLSESERSLPVTNE